MQCTTKIVSIEHYNYLISYNVLICLQSGDTIDFVNGRIIRPDHGLIFQERGGGEAVISRKFFANEI